MATGKIKRLAAVLLVIVLGSTAAGCYPSYRKVKLGPPEEIETVTAPTPQYRPRSSDVQGLEGPYLRMAIVPVISPLQTRGSYRELLEYFPQELDRPVDLVFRSTYAEISQLLEQGLVDLALIGSWSYIMLEKNEGYELLATAQINGEASHRSYIITSPENHIKSLEDLEGKKFAFTDPFSFSGKHYAFHLVEQMGESPAEFFPEYIYSYSHYNSVIAVAEGWVEAAVVNSLVFEALLEEHPKLNEKVRIVNTSPPAGNPPLVVNREISSELRGEIKDLLISMHEDERGEKALSELGVERFVPAQKEKYDYIRAVQEESSSTEE